MDPATFRDPRLLAQLRARIRPGDDPDAVAAREVARYYGLLARELATVQLTHEETTVLGDAAHAAEQARIAGSPFGSLADAVASKWRRTMGLSDRLTVRGDELVAKVTGWTPGQTLAVFDAFERLRALRCRDGWSDARTMRRAVGLLRDGAGMPGC